MPTPANPESCPRCASRWTWTGKGWLVVDVHGRGSMISFVTGSPVEAPPRELAHCPNCRQRLRATASLAPLAARERKHE